MHYRKVSRKEKKNREAMNMKKLFILMAVLGFSATAMATDQSFNATMKLFKPITITKVQDLLFPDTTITGSAFTVTVLPADSGAATFNAVGGNNRTLTRSVVESSINMTSGAMTMAVDTFAVTGPTAFTSGAANGFKVGATAHVTALDLDGDYSGAATFRVVYQ